MSQTPEKEENNPGPTEMMEPVFINADGNIQFNMTPKQRMMIESDCDELFFGGAAMGAKSMGLLLFCAKRRMEHPRTQGIILRRTFPELDKSIIRDSYRVFLPLGAKFNSSKRNWTFPNGSIQDFGHAETDGDVYKYWSAQYTDMCFDEASQFSEFQIINLKTRCRSVFPGVKPLVRLASNPGGISHRYLYERYVKPSYVHKIWNDEATNKTMTFIPALMTDNPFGMLADPDYDARLKELPEKKYLALAKGRWDTFEGAYFSEWDPEGGHHVLTSPRRPDSATLKYISLDWGFSDPASVHWWELTPYGRLFCYRELYITRLGPKNLAKTILEMCPKGEVYEWLVAPPEIWGKTADFKEGGETIQQAMQQEFADRIMMIKANNTRIEGWLKCREYLSPAKDGKPWVQFSPVCPNIIREIPAAIHDDQKPEEIDSGCSDHALDDFRYLVMALTNVPRESTNPYESGYEKIFGIKHRSEQSQIVLPSNHGGY